MRKSQNLGTKKLVGRWGRFYSFRTKKLLEWTFPILYYGPQGKNVDYYPRRRIYGCKKLRVLLLSAGEGELRYREKIQEVQHSMRRDNRNSTIALMRLTRVETTKNKKLKFNFGNELIDEDIESRLNWV